MRDRPGQGDCGGDKEGKTMFRNSKCALITVLLLFVALPALAGEEVTKDGVLHIMNGTEPSGKSVC